MTEMAMGESDDRRDLPTPPGNQPAKDPFVFGGLDWGKPKGSSETEYLEYLDGLPTFEDFGGLDTEIAELIQAAEELHVPAEILDEYGLKRGGGVLLQGPGGVGKTSLVQALARHMRAEYREITSKDVLTKFVGESAMKLSTVYKNANSAGHEVLLCFNEFDGLFRRDAGGNEGVADTVIAEYKTILDHPEKYPNVMTATTANSLEKFDPSLLRASRFPHVIEIGLPNDEARAAIFGIYILRRPQHFAVLSPDMMVGLADSSSELVDFADPVNINELVVMTDGWSGDDIKVAVQAPLWENALFKLRTEKTPEIITQQRLKRAVINHSQSRPSGTDLR